MMNQSRTSNGTAVVFRGALCLFMLVALSGGCSDGDGNGSATGNNEGAVMEQDGTPVADASVVVLDGETEVATTSTSEDGTFTLSDLPAGAYTIAVFADGFEGLEAAILAHLQMFIDGQAKEVELYGKTLLVVSVPIDS